MTQKYKFFIKDKAITFRQAAESEKTKQSDEDYWINILLKLKLDEDHVVDLKNINAFCDKIFHRIKTVKAGGGYVINDFGLLLMIERLGFWDLPKGKQEKGESIEETAIREVEEECGIDELELLSKPFETFHLYKEGSETLLKHSYWFKMKTNSTKKLNPQTEENITNAVWVSLPPDQSYLNGAYASIREVIRHFA
ncbi:MAG: NUDIX domain-containing protein [Salibacteraceae bacterium]